MSLRLIFMGTPDFAVPTLRAVAERHEVLAVYTRAPKPAGRRGLELTPTPVEREARLRGLPVRHPASLRNEEQQAEFLALRADAAVVVAYGLILPKAILEGARLGCFNLHPSLLPRWRGAAPIHRAIMAGDAETGATVMHMDEGLDTGAMTLIERTAIAADMTTGDLHDVLAQQGADLVARALDELERDGLVATPQPAEGVTYAAKIDKGETRIDWSKPWTGVHNHIRGLSPFPGAWCEMPGLGRVKILRTTRGAGEGAPGAVLDGQLTVACGEGAVRILELQKAGSRALSAEEFLHGTPLGRGAVLT